MVSWPVRNVVASSSSQRKRAEAAPHRTPTKDPKPTRQNDHLCLANPGFVAGIPCGTNDVCQSGICNRYSGSCASHCCSDADCGAGLSCLVYDLDATSGDIVKVCAPKTAGSGSTPIGGSCTAPNDCESEVCVNTDINNPNSPRVCSTLCCTNADCGGITSGRCIPVGGPTVGTQSTIVGLCAPVP